VISPIDAFPELFLAFIGLIDDAIVVAWIAGAFLAETDRFLAWEVAVKAGKGARKAPHQAPPPREDIIEGEIV